MNTPGDHIAVFDSGVGGLSVLAQLRRVMPGERFVYYGDSVNAPYGTRSVAEVQRLTFAVVSRLLPYGVKALVVACNTITSAAVTALREAFPSLIVVGIEPALKPAAERFPGGTVGVLATPMTLHEEKFRLLLDKYRTCCRVVPIPAPELVELVEAGKGVSAEAEALLTRLLFPYLGQLDALVLGCTHYPFAAPAIRRVLGNKVRLMDGSDGTARETQRRLAQAGLLENGAGELLLLNSQPGAEILALSRRLLAQLTERSL